MKTTRTVGSVLAVSMMMAVVFLYSNYAARSSDHQDSPATIAHPGADITDPYIFPSPTNPNNVVMVMNVHPLIPSGQGLSTYFDPGVLYQMKFDTKSENGGALSQAPVENLVIQFQAGAPGAAQPIYVYGPAAPSATGATGNKPVSLTGQGTINVPFTLPNGIQVFAGAREDSFFFDLAQFLKILPDRNAGNTTTALQPGGLPSCLPQKLGGNDTCPQGFNPPGVATDTLKGFNVLSFVIELPRSMLTVNGGGPKIAFWVTTSTTSGQ